MKYISCPGTLSTSCYLELSILHKLGTNKVF